MRPGSRITTVSHQLCLQNYLRSAPESRPARTDVCGLALLLPDPRAQEEGPDPARPGGATSPRLQRAGPDPSRLSQSSTRSIHLQAAISGKEQDEQQPNKTFAFVEAQPTPLTAHSYNKINYLSISRLVHPLAAALSTPSQLLPELTADLSSRCLAPSARISRLEPTTTARFAGWRRGAGRVAEEGALPEPHPAGCLSAGPAALGRSLQSAPGWMWSQASESRSPRLPSISCKGSSTHLLAAFLLT